LYPTIIGDFYSVLGLTDMWQDQAEMESAQTWAKVIAVIFAFCSFNLVVAIV